MAIASQLGALGAMVGVFFVYLGVHRCSSRRMVWSGALVIALSLGMVAISLATREYGVHGDLGWYVILDWASSGLFIAPWLGVAGLLGLFVLAAIGRWETAPIARDTGYALLIAALLQGLGVFVWFSEYAQ